MPSKKSDSKLSTLEQKKKLITLNWKQMWTKIGRRENSKSITYNRMVFLESMITILSMSAYENTGYNYFLFFLSSYEKRQDSFCSLFLQSLIHTSLNYEENGRLPYSARFGGSTEKLRTSSTCGLIVNICLTREHQIEDIVKNFDTDFNLYQIREYINASIEEDKEILE